MLLTENRKQKTENRRMNFKFIRAFTLIEAMVGIVIIITTIMGPLSIAISSSSYARDTKDKMTAIYLAQEAIDILRFERDSLLIKCNQNLSAVCQLQDLGLGDGSIESPANAAWRKFKVNLGMTFDASNIGSSPSCFVTDFGGEPGCSFDFYGFTNIARFPLNLSPLAPTKYLPTDTNCDYLYRSASSTSGGVYLCSGSNPSFINVDKTKFSRVIKLKSLNTISSDTYFAKYNDDIRVSSTVTYTRASGFTKSVEVVDFLHTKI